MNRRSFFSRMAAAAAGVVIASSVEVFGKKEEPFYWVKPKEIYIQDLPIFTSSNEWHRPEGNLTFNCPKPEDLRSVQTGDWSCSYFIPMKQPNFHEMTMEDYLES